MKNTYIRFFLTISLLGIQEKLNKIFMRYSLSLISHIKHTRICLHICVCVSVREREKERERDGERKVKNPRIIEYVLSIFSYYFLNLLVDEDKVCFLLGFRYSSGPFIEFSFISQCSCHVFLTLILNNNIINLLFGNINCIAKSMEAHRNRCVLRLDFDREKQINIVLMS